MPMEVWKYIVIVLFPTNEENFKSMLKDYFRKPEQTLNITYFE